MNETQQKAQAVYEDATRKLRGNILNGPFGLQGRGYEAAYATAYQGLVKAGLALQLKGKYRQ